MKFSKFLSCKDTQQLPNDMITEIFEYLPVKSLLRFRCVSKFWGVMIRSPCFAHNHLLKQKKNPNCVLLLWNYLPPLNNKKGTFNFFNLESPLDKVYPNLSVPLLKNYSAKNICLLGPCNGLVCMISDENVSLCNPTLKEYKEIPNCNVACSNADFDFKFIGQGFGNTCTGDYKVALIWRFREKTSQKLFIHLHVFSSSTNSWKKIDADPKLVPNVPHPCGQFFFNGACHWPAISFYRNPATTTILTFNLSTEYLKQLEYPDGCIKKNNENLSTYPYPIVVNNFLGFVQEVSSDLTFDVWVMKEYGKKESWTKQFRIGPYLDSYPLVPWKDSEWLFADMDTNGQIVSYALTKTEIKRFEIFGVEKNMHALTHKESLISLDEVLKSIPMIKLD